MQNSMITEKERKKESLKQFCITVNRKKSSQSSKKKLSVNKKKWKSTAAYFPSKRNFDKNKCKSVLRMWEVWKGYFVHHKGRIGNIN